MFNLALSFLTWLTSGTVEKVEEQENRWEPTQVDPEKKDHADANTPSFHTPQLVDLNRKPKRRQEESDTSDYGGDYPRGAGPLAAPPMGARPPGVPYRARLPPAGIARRARARTGR